MAKILFVFLLTVCSVGHASNLTCQLTEKLAGKEATQEIAFSVPETNQMSGEFFSGFGKGKIVLENDQLSLTLIDPRFKKSVIGRLGALPGHFTRLQIIPDERRTDYLIIDCQRDGYSEYQDVDFASCELTETAGSKSFKSKFEVPLAQNGHDFSPLENIKIAPLTGWVMLYNGALIVTLQNKDLLTSLTGMGSWDQPVFVSWYPSAQNIRVDLSCQPKIKE